MKKCKYGGVYEVLDKIRKRPGSYLGHVSIGHLEAFMSGLQFGDLDPGSPSLWDFVHWHTATLEKPTSFPWGAFEEDRVGGEAAVSAYLSRLDEYRDCTVILRHVHRGPFAARFQTWGLTGFEVPVPPECLVISQYEPSPVYRLDEGRYERGKEWGRFFPSVAAAMKFASEQWAASPGEWMPTQQVVAADEDGSATPPQPRR